MAEQALIDTLALLEWRLQRLEFLLSTPLNANGDPSNPAPIPTRFRRLEYSLQQLGRNSETAGELLRMNAQNPDVFSDTSSDEDDDEESIPPTPSQKLAIILSEAPSLSSTTSQLRHLADMPIPSSSTFAKMITLGPRIAQAAERQIEQSEQISELRKRSGALVLRWHEGMVLGQGRCWADWDERVRECEKYVRRQEVRREGDK